jgi:hypothetical protein
MFAVILFGLGIGLGHGDQLQKAGAVRIRLCPFLRHLFPETVHDFLAVLIAEVREVTVRVVAL